MSTGDGGKKKKKEKDDKKKTTKKKAAVDGKKGKDKVVKKKKVRLVLYFLNSCRCLCYHFLLLRINKHNNLTSSICTCIIFNRKRSNILSIPKQKILPRNSQHRQRPPPPHLPRDTPPNKLQSTT